MSSASSEVIWLRQLLYNLDFLILGPTPLNADNTSAIEIANNPIFHEWTKHIEVDYRFICQHVLSSIIHLPHISS